MIEFLTQEQALFIHAEQIAAFGGSPGVRDLALLDSALAQPQATFFGKFLHADLHEMAAAYLFHIAKNHPFVDGNKRVAAEAALVFLQMNGLADTASDELIANLTLAVAAGQLNKSDVALFFREHTEEIA